MEEWARAWLEGQRSKGEKRYFRCARAQVFTLTWPALSTGLITANGRSTRDLTLLMAKVKNVLIELLIDPI